MDKNNISLLLSAFSVAVASVSLGWNIFRDVILKAKVQVNCRICDIVGHGRPPVEKIDITVTNFGPGPVTLSMIEIREATLWQRVTRRDKFAVVIHDYMEPMSAHLPVKIEVGDKIDLLLPYDIECFLAHPVTHIGVGDSFGRTHWVPKKKVKEARTAWLNRFAAVTKSQPPG